MEGKYMANVYYRIDASGLEKNGRDLAGILVSRRCQSCMDHIEETGDIPSAKDQMNDIAECCSSNETFIDSRMPLREIVFRLLLKQGAKPVSLADIHYALTEDLAHPTHPMNVEVSVLGKILENDSYYGFQKVGERSDKARKSRRKNKAD